MRRLVDELGQPIGPFRVWLQRAWVPGLAMSRAIGDTLAHKCALAAFCVLALYCCQSPCQADGELCERQEVLLWPDCVLRWWPL